MPPRRTKICARIFVSSTYKDLKLYRDEVYKVLIRLEALPYGMEFLGSTPNKPLEECLKKVDESLIYIGIIAHRYGDVDESSKKSFTQLEYEKARKIGLPCLIYIIDGTYTFPPEYYDEGEKKEKLVAFKEMLKTDCTVSEFTTPDNLAMKIAVDLPRVIKC
jgi:hypothetical protein